jgi:hypothetical protein
MVSSSAMLSGGVKPAKAPCGAAEIIARSSGGGNKKIINLF